MTRISCPWLRATDLNIRASEDYLFRLNQIIMQVHARVEYSRRLVIESELLRAPTHNPFRDRPTS